MMAKRNAWAAYGAPENPNSQKPGDQVKRTTAVGRIIEQQRQQRDEARAFHVRIARRERCIKAVIIEAQRRLAIEMRPQLESLTDEQLQGRYWREFGDAVTKADREVGRS